MRVLVTSIAHPTHFFTLVPVAWALKAAGHEVRVAVQPSVVDVVTGAGLTAVTVGDDQGLMEFIAEIGGDPSPYQGGMDFVGTREAPHSWEHALGQQVAMSALCFAPLSADGSIDDLVAHARAWRPDLVLWEPFTMGGGVAALAVGAAHARVLWGPDVIGHARAQFSALAADVPDAAREDPLGEWLRATCARHGVVVDDEALEELVVGQASLDSSPAALRLPAAGPVMAHRFVPHTGRGVVPAWSAGWPDRRRVVVTLGMSARDTTSDDLLDLGEFLARAGEIDAEVVVTVDPADVADLDVPDNVRVVEFAPFDALLPTCSAIVHHGGAGTCSTATLHGLVQVVVGDLWDAPLKGVLLDEAGAGIALDPGVDGVDALVDAIGRALSDPDLRQGARRLGEQARALPGADALVRSLEQLAAERTTTHPRRQESGS